MTQLNNKNILITIKYPDGNIALNTLDCMQGWQLYMQCNGIQYWGCQRILWFCACRILHRISQPAKNWLSCAELAVAQKL